MNSASIASDDKFSAESFDSNNSSLLSGVSWGSIFAGAAGAFSLSMVLFILGIGLGLTTISPWRGSSLSPAGHGIAALLWLTVTQIIASIVGGYLAGRLRVKWVKVHDNEVFFRDTAHGFIAWSVATLGAALFFVMPVMILVNSGANVASEMLSNMGTKMQMQNSATQTGLSPLHLDYFVDSLFRADPKLKSRVVSNDNDNVTRILVIDLAKGELPSEDKSYIAQVVADRTGRSTAEEEQRVETLFRNMVMTEQNIAQRAKEAAETARKATVRASLWTVIALLVGAFSASLAATYGGRLRDKIS